MMMISYWECLGLVFASKGFINIMLNVIIYEDLIIKVIIKLFFKSCFN